MKLILLFAFLAFSGVVLADDIAGMHFQQGCFIHNAKGELLKSPPGVHCIFFPDGSFVSGSDSSIRMFGPDLSVRWELNVPVHHQVNLSHDGKRILALSSKVKDSYRIDRFVVISLDGKILQDRTFDEIAPDRLIDVEVDGEWQRRLGATREHSHFNSFHEIPEIPYNPKFPFYKSGNYIVNALLKGTFILSPDLKTVLHSFGHPRSVDFHTHDVQVLPNGNIFLFNNVLKDESDLRMSQVEELNPYSLEPVFTFGGKSQNHFFSLHTGSVQRLDDDRFVYSLQWQGVYVVSKKQNKVIHSTLGVNISGRYIPTQNVRLLNLSEFLKNYTGQ